ncbi:MAG: DUF489 family protein [Ghiorsea sp.]
MNESQHKAITHEQREKQRALALAALTQTAYMVESIAQEGKCEHLHFEQLMDALLDSNYTEKRQFPFGSHKAKQLLLGKNIKHAKHILSHTASLIAIEKKLSKQPETLGEIADGMKRVQRQTHYFDSPYHENVCASVAHLYGETISPIKPRIIVRGKPEYLNQKRHTEQIRCLLFSGIRAAWVWRTNGGNTLRLLFGRKRLINQLSNTSQNTP